MAWTHYKLKFRLLSPMHIGYRKVGNLMQTRKYVPGKNVWAALTARLTRDYHDGSKGDEYKKIGKKLIGQFRFGYLWPSLDGIEPYFFWDHEEDHEDFDYLLLDSYASAALDYSAYSTEEGSLHETEFVAPVARNGYPVFLLGDLWKKDDEIEGKIDDESWQRSMENLQLGGERTYGWGRVAICSEGWSGNSSRQGITALGHRWQEEGEEIVFIVDKGKRITAHALAARTESQSNAFGGVPTKDVSGSIEPMVGREWSDSAGKEVSYGGVYFLPGSKTTKEEARFIIDCFGRWTSGRG